MPRQERIRRWETLMQGLKSQDVNAWRDSFVSALHGIHARPVPVAVSLA
jgi:trehalose 6-phosphate synthase